jgi:hypothetical protein
MLYLMLKRRASELFPRITIVINIIAGKFSERIIPSKRIMHPRSIAIVDGFWIFE